MNSEFRYIRFIITVYIQGLLFFTLFRLFLFLTALNQMPIIPHGAYYISRAFLMGLRFDIVVSGYLLFLPFLALAVIYAMQRQSKIFNRIITIYISILYTLSFAICATDIPYFGYYFSRLTISALLWTEHKGFMFKMITEEKSYVIYIFVFIVLIGLFYWLIRRSRKNILDKTTFRTPQNLKNFVLKFLPVTILIAGLMFLGIRGRLAHKSPIRVGTAYFSNYAFPNQLGLNPVYTFLRSYLDSRNPKNKVLHLMNDEEAIKNTRKMFGIDSTLLNISPVARMVNPTGKEVKANVIIIIMESMSAEKMGRFGNTGNLTPHLDSISRISACFDHVYSAGIHTMNGIYSTLFGLPALLRQHPMKGVTIPACSGFSNILPGKGYQTIYITTHDEQFDNVGGFLHANGFQKMISQKDYPSSKVLSTLGVPDHFMFEFSIPFLNDLNKNNQPFFATFVTGSDHGPYIIPEGISFTPHAQNIRQQIVEYADWSIGRFLKLASEQPWFANTIFVFIADHGATLDNSVYDMPLTGNHTPLIIFSSRLVKPSVSKYFGGQIDIFPTVMGLLNIPYVNNTMGVDLFREKRPYMHFSADNKIGCIDENFFYVIRDNKIESLYKYRTNDTKNYLANEKQHADSMKNYAFSMMQTTQWMLLNKKTAVPKPK